MLSLLFSFLNVAFLINFSSQSTLKIIHDDSSSSNSSDVSSHDADHVVIKHLHQIYNTDLQKKDTDVKHLLILKQQYIVRNHIEEFETDFALNFVPDWSKVDKWSSPCRQSIEIRRQKWEYIFEKHSDLEQVKSLSAELAKAGVNQSTFCREIAEAYFILSHNSYVYNRGPKPDSKQHKINEFVNHPQMDKSLKVFVNVFPDSQVALNETEDLVHIPKSVYHKLLRKDSHIHLLKKHHETEMNRQKDSYENKIKNLKDANYSSYENTDLDTDNDTDDDTDDDTDANDSVSDSDSDADTDADTDADSS